MSTNPILANFAGWEAYCENCEKFRQVRQVISRDSEVHREYHELLCTSCAGVLFTYQQRGPRVD